MARIISGKELLEAVREESFIKNCVESNCEGIKYYFRISSEFGVIRQRKIKLLENGGAMFVVKHGETMLMATKEILELPEDMFCQLISDEKTSYEEILVLDGFCVGLGDRGPLIFGLYNVSQKDSFFQSGQKFIAGIFYKLEPEEVEAVRLNPSLIYDFANNRPTSMEMFQRGLKGLWKDIEEQKLKELFAKEKLERKKMLVKTSFLAFLLGVFITVIIVLLLRHT